MNNRVERILAYMVAGIIVLSLASFVAVIIATASGLEPRDFTSGVWPVITVLPLIGLPIGFLLLIALLIVNGVRRSRESRQGAD